MPGKLLHNGCGYPLTEELSHEEVPQVVKARPASPYPLLGSLEGLVQPELGELILSMSQDLFGKARKTETLRFRAIVQSESTCAWVAT